jgi:nucleolar protein 53
VERTLRKRLHASVDSAKSLRKAADRTSAARVEAAAERRAKREARLAQTGLAGQKLGKHVVREGGVEVQLGEELSESLRGLQVRMTPLLCLIYPHLDECPCFPLLATVARRWH